MLENASSARQTQRADDRKKTEGTYVSEFESFMNRFLEEHPEVVDDQHRGMAIYWDCKVDLSAQEKAETDKVKDDQYGFYPRPRLSGDISSPEDINGR